MATATLLEKTDRETTLACISKLGIAADNIRFVPAGIAAFIRSEDKTRFAFPTAVLWRKTPTWTTEPRHSHPAVIHSVPYGVVSADGVVSASIAKLSLIPCQLSYTLDYWCVDRRQQDEIIYNYAWWHRYEPLITFTEQETTGTYQQTWDFHVRFDDPVDNSEIESKYTKGKIYRVTLPFTVMGSMARVIEPNEQAIFYVKERMYID